VTSSPDSSRRAITSVPFRASRGPDKFRDRSSPLIILPKRCEFPGCTRPGDHRHHIVYHPEEVVKLLCREHHAEITMLNGIYGRRFRHPLSSKHRWWLWHQWIAGKKKPRRTRKALEYIQEWDRKPAAPLLMAERRLPEPIEEVPQKVQRSVSKKERQRRTTKQHRRMLAKKKRGSAK
jgi:hypothetical protein